MAPVDFLAGRCHINGELGGDEAFKAIMMKARRQRLGLPQQARLWSGGNGVLVVTAP